MAKLYFYYAAMNAGKSTTLLQVPITMRSEASRYYSLRLNLMIATVSAKSPRASASSERPRSSTETPIFSRRSSRFTKTKTSTAFLSMRLSSVPRHRYSSSALICDKLDIPVLAYGLRTDFQGEPFEGSRYLLAWAEELVEIKTVCSSGKKATMNARLDADGNRMWEGAQVDIGHHYLAMSRREFELERVTPVDYEIPQSVQDALKS